MSLRSQPSDTWNFSIELTDNGFNSTDLWIHPGTTEHDSADHWQAFGLIVFVLAGITGNVLVCIAVHVEKRLHNVTNYFLVSLAVADLLVSVVVMPCSIIQELNGYWPLGFVICDVWQASDVMLCTSSIWHMCTISIDRYHGIRYPLRAAASNRSPHVVGVKIAGVWFVSLAITSPLVVIGVIRPDQIMSVGTPSTLGGEPGALDGATRCAVTNPDFLVYGSISAFFLPLSIMLVAYAASIRLLAEQARRLADPPPLQAGAGAVSGGAAEANGGLRRTRSSRRGRDADDLPDGGRVVPELVTVDRQNGLSGSSGVASVSGLLGRLRAMRRVSKGRSASRYQSVNKGELNYVCTTPDAADEVKQLRRGAEEFVLCDAADQSTSATEAEQPDVRTTFSTIADGNAATHAQSTLRRSRDSTSFGETVSTVHPVDLPLLHPVSNAAICDFASTETAAVDSDQLPAENGSGNAAQLSLRFICCFALSTASLSSSAAIETDQLPAVENGSGITAPAAVVVGGTRFRSLVHKHNTAIRVAGELLTRGADAHRRVTRRRAQTTVRTERKAARVIGVMFALFVACWTPFFVVNVALGLCGGQRRCRSGVGSEYVRAVEDGWLYSTFLWLGYASSTLNPIVYTAFNGTFRRTFVRLLTCRHRPEKNSAQLVAARNLTHGTH